MNIEATSSKPKEKSFLSNFSFEQQEYLQKAGVENKEIFDLMMKDPTFKSELEAEKNRKVAKKEKSTENIVVEKENVVEKQEKQTAEVGLEHAPIY